MSLFFILLCTISFAAGQYFDWDTVTPLDEYVNRPDDDFDYFLIEEYVREGFTMYVFNMTSHKWMDESDSRMVYLGDFAKNTGAVAGRVKQIPNQPIYFMDSPDVARNGDEYIARGWRYYTEELIDDYDITALSPMTKAAKRAVDAIVEWTELQTGYTIDKIFPSGYSKRGWTSWLLGCVDPRVFAIAPIVLDLGNWHPNLHHHYQAYGGWSWAFTPYLNENVTMYLDHPRFAEIFDVIAEDFMRYNTRLTMPKLIISASSDEFFLPDDTWYFFDELSEPKYFWLVENTSHGTSGFTDMINRMLMDFFVAVLEEHTFPQMTWERSEHGTHGDINVECDQEPLNYTAWWADTSLRTCENRTIDEEEEFICRRDFRLETLLPPGNNDIVWEETDVDNLGEGRYRVRVDVRDEDVDGPGYRAFFMNMVFAGARPGDELRFTSEVNIIPDILPYDRCSSEAECRGRVV